MRGNDTRQSPSAAAGAVLQCASAALADSRLGICISRDRRRAGADRHRIFAAMLCRPRLKLHPHSGCNGSIRLHHAQRSRLDRNAAGSRCQPRSAQPFCLILHLHHRLRHIYYGQIYIRSKKKQKGSLITSAQKAANRNHRNHQNYRHHRSQRLRSLIPTLNLKGSF